MLPSQWLLVIYLHYQMSYHHMAACVFKEYTRNFGLWSRYQKYRLLFAVPCGPITMLGACCPPRGLPGVHYGYMGWTWTPWDLWLHTQHVQN